MKAGAGGGDELRKSLRILTLRKKKESEKLPPKHWASVARKP